MIKVSQIFPASQQFNSYKKPPENIKSVPLISAFLTFPGEFIALNISKAIIRFYIFSVGFSSPKYMNGKNNSFRDSDFDQSILEIYIPKDLIAF